MAAFSLDDWDWQRIDVQAIVSNGGLASIEDRHREACHEWLRAGGYAIDSLDCTREYEGILAEIGRIFHWEEQFGYSLESGAGNLDAIRDGFQYTIPEEGGQVLEFFHPEVMWRKDPQWMLALLSFAREHSRYQLAIGRRFFALLTLEPNSRLTGQKMEDDAVPHVFWRPFREDPFTP